VQGHSNTGGSRPTISQPTPVPCGERPNVVNVPGGGGGESVHVPKAINDPVAMATLKAARLACVTAIAVACIGAAATISSAVITSKNDAENVREHPHAPVRRDHQRFIEDLAVEQQPQARPVSPTARTLSDEKAM
jgi:hypothetical protein